jgi:nitric-oxide synthase
MRRQQSPVSIAPNPNSGSGADADVLSNPKPAVDPPSTADLDPDRVLREAEQFFALPELAFTTARRRDEVREQVRRWGSYVQTPAELAIGARLAWRNHARCVGRAHWRLLRLFDERSLSRADDIADACFRHLHFSTDAGRIRPTITVFAPDWPDGPRVRILNRQLVGYAGHRIGDRAGENGRAGDRQRRWITGDPANASTTELATDLGWRGRGTRFDVLPLLLEVDGRRSWHALPPASALRVPIRHPRHRELDALGLQWHANPAVADMELSVGGVLYPAAPFSGWYVTSEIGARDLSDDYRYDQLPVVAAALGLDTRREWTHWRDQALLALTEAVTHSFRAAGVRSVDHHTVSRQFLRFLHREEAAGRTVATDWSWVNPPLSASATPTFHRLYPEPDPRVRPAFLRTGGCPVNHAADAD